MLVLRKFQQLDKVLANKHEARGDILADFTLSKIPRDIRSSLTDDQYEAIRSAIAATANSSRHSIDIRFVIPLFFRSYYFVFFAGRDRRKKTIELELNRIERLPKNLRRTVYFSAVASILVSVGVFLLGLIYLAKSFAGIDFFDGIHLSDLIPIDLFAEAKKLFGSDQ